MDSIFCTAATSLINDRHTMLSPYHPVIQHRWQLCEQRPNYASHRLIEREITHFRLKQFPFDKIFG